MDGYGTGLGFRARRVALDSFASQVRQDKAFTRKKKGKKGVKCGRGWISPDKDCGPQDEKGLRQKPGPEEKPKKERSGSGAGYAIAGGLLGTAALAGGAAAILAARGAGEGETGLPSSPPQAKPSKPSKPPKPPKRPKPPKSPRPPKPPGSQSSSPPAPIPPPAPPQTPPPPRPQPSPQGQTGIFPRGVDRGTYDDYPSRKPGDHPGVAKILKNVEDGIRNEPYEWLVGINAKTGEEIFRITDRHPTMVDIEGNHPEVLNTLLADSGDIILTHNHPGSGGPLSDADLGAYIKTPSREMRACDSSGVTYSFLCSDEMKKDPDLFPYLERVGREEGENFQKRMEEIVRQEGPDAAHRVGQRELSATLLRAGGRIAADWQHKGARYTVIQGGGKADSFFIDFYPRWDSALKRLVQN